MRRARVALLAVFVLLLNCRILERDAPTPTPETLPTLTVAPSRVLTPTIVTATRVSTSTSTAARDSYQLIDDALGRGTIDLDHAAAYRLYALFANPNLPAEFASPLPIQSDGMGAFYYAFQDWEKLNPATKATMSDFVTPRAITLTPPDAATTTATAAPRFALGVYISAITPQDNLKSAWVGKWELEFKAGIVAVFALEGKRVITAEYSAIENQIKFVDQIGSYACKEVGRAGIYRWMFEGDALKLARVDDPCADRAALLQAHSWRK